MKDFRYLLVYILLLFVSGCASTSSIYNSHDVGIGEKATLLINTYGNGWTARNSMEVVEVNEKLVEEKLSVAKVEFLPGEYTLKFKRIGRPGIAEGMVVGLVGGTSAVYAMHGSASNGQKIENGTITINMKAGYFYIVDHAENDDGSYSILIREI